LKENQKEDQAKKSKVLGANRNLLAFLKTIILQSTHKIRSHSSGASSASGMAALAMNFMSLEKY
jgi:mevalonate pyrophosphate decarboxylase